MVRVVICDDQDVVRDGMQVILGAAHDIDIVGLARDGAEAVDLVANKQPDVVLMDLMMPGMNGIEATRVIRQRFPDVRILVLTTYDADEWVFDAIRSGASGYLLKDMPRASIIQAVLDTADGKTPVDPGVAGKLFSAIANPTSSTVDSTLLKSLSPREIDLWRLLGDGLTNADIAKRLYLSEGTVRNYISRLLQKLHVTDRTQAAVLATRYGLMDYRE